MSSEDTQGEALLSGKIISGGPEPIPLFGPEAVLTELEQVTGGTVHCAKDETRVAFLPDGAPQAFQILARFLVRPQEDKGSRTIAFDIPRALRNSVDLQLPPEARLIEPPGIVDADGIYHFAASSRLSIHYLDTQGLGAAAIIEVDAVSRLRVHRNRVLITTWFLPVHIAPGALILQAPEGAKFISSSLGASRITKLDDGRYAINIHPSEKGPFSIEFALEGLTEDGEFSFPLPRLEGNSGQQGRFAIDEPDDGQVTVAAEGLVPQIPVAKLGEVLGALVKEKGFYMSIPAQESVTLTITRFQPVSTPTTILDCQYFFTSFEDNGTTLSVLAMDIPPEVGARMTLKAVPDSEIWSLTVNGAKKNVYAGEEDMWIIPLESGQVSRVELAFLRQGTKLGLQGKLEAIVPESGLPSQELRVGVALPARVELLSVEGPVNVATPGAWKLPVEFVGKQHFFSRPFYKGEGMVLSISYKEPVNHTR